MNKTGITTVIVSRGMRPLLELCLAHLARALAWERATEQDRVVVIDNASPTPYAARSFETPGCDIIRYDLHHPFAACCNAGIRRHPNEYYLMLNNDVVLHERALAGMLAFLGAGEHIGICGARLVYPDGTLQHGGMKLGPLERGPYHADRGTPSEQVARGTRELQAVTAACMLLRHQVVAETGGFDEAFPFAWEDVDLCLRARQKGWRVVCCHDVDSIHFESLTPGRMDMDAASREVFERRWKEKWSVDG